MKFINLSDYNLQTKIYWLLMLGASLLVTGFAVFELFSFAWTQFVVLAGLLIIAVPLNQHQFKIPQTGLRFSARKFLVFFAALWLGVPGATLLAAVSSGVKYRLSIKDRNHYLLGVFANTVSGFAAAQILYSALRHFAGFDEKVIAANSIGFEWLLLSAALMTASHYVLNSVLNAGFLKFECDYPILSLWRESYLATAISYAVALTIALLAYIALLQFGLWFGLVVLPAVIVAHVAYRIHLQKLAQKTRQITEANRIHVATVEALATAIDARDQVGVGHVRRVQIYAVGIGEEMNLPTDEIEALRTGALLHDIGKLAVPDHILNKPDKLTPAEFEKAKIHSAVGALILEKVNFPYPVVPTVKYHHEWWDGTGYPNNLKGEAIPLAARILAVADVYDALRGARSYRPGLSREEARKVLITGAGTQFDPKLVDVFLRNLRKFEVEVKAHGLAYDFDDDAEELAIGTIAEPILVDTGQDYITQIKRANREVSALYELARLFSSSLNLEETLSLLAGKIGGIVPFDTFVVYLMDKDGDFAVAAHAEGKNAAKLKNKRVKPGAGATGYVLQNRQSLNNINPALDFSFYQLDFVQDYSGMASVPLVTDEKLIGAVSLYSCDLEVYEDEYMRLLEAVSHIASDAISKSQQHAEAESRALTDPMTNLPNARSLQSQFEAEVARARRSGNEFQVLMLDLDGFKAVNDTFGHKTGDVILKEISRVMRGQLRDYDFLARYAGDEFVAIIPETDGRDVRELCERLEKAVRGFVLPVADDRFARVGVSLGAASYPHHGETLDQVLIAADKAMYAVKAQHKQESAPARDAAEEELHIVELDESHIVSTAIN